MSDSQQPDEDLPQHVEDGEGNWLVSYADMMTLLVGFFVILLSFSNVDQEKFEKVKRFTSEEFGGTYVTTFGSLADRIRKRLEELGLGKETVIKQSDKGVTISLRGTVFFDSGSVAIKPKAQALLDAIVPIIQAEQNEDALNIVIEGHTDDDPILPNFIYKTNWELSSIRSCRVLQIFQEAGFDSKRLTAIGFGESRPLLPNRDEQGKSIEKNKDQNRRVIIHLRKAPFRLVGTEESDPDLTSQ